MISRALNTVSAVAWATVLLSIVVFLFVAVCAPETTLVRNVGERDERIQSIQTSGDLRQVQGAATSLLEAGYATSHTAMILCRLFLGTLLLAVGGAVVTLRQVRGIRKQSQEHLNRAEPDASPNGGPAERLRNSGAGGGPPSVS